MPSPLVELITRIRGMIASGESSQTIGASFETLIERTEAVEDELRTFKAKSEDELLERRAEDAEASAENSQSEVQAMQATLERAMEEIKRLRAEADERDWHNGEHDKKMMEVMELIAESAVGCQNNTADAWISFRFDIGIELSRHYIATLVSRVWIRHTGKGNSVILTDEGRAKLAALGRLK